MAGARREAVALGEVLRAGDAAGHLVQARSAGFDGQHRTQETAGVFVHGMAQDVGYRTLFDHLAGVHDRDGVGHLGDERQVVAHEHHREAQLLLQLVQQVDDLLLHGHVESRSGLVGDDELRVARQRHGDEHALALAAGQFVGVGVKRALRIESHQLQQLLGRAGSSALRELLHLGFDQHGRVQRRERVLIDHGDFATAQGVHLLLIHVQQVLAVVEDLAGHLSLRIQQPHDGKGGDGLAAAGLAHKTHGLARAHHEAHVVDHVHVAVARELDAQILHFQNRRHVGARLEAVGARLLNRLKLAEALFEHLRLGGVCQRGVGHERRTGCCPTWAWARECRPR